jgi:hypothetical protein
MLSTSIKSAALAFTAMAAIGTATPLAVYLVNEHQTGTPTVVQQTQAPTPGAMLRAAETIEEPMVAEELEVTAAVPRAVVQPRHAEKKLERKCTWHESEAIISGRVRICDVDRTSNEHPEGTFKVEKKTQKLAPRDTPSPSGFLE